MSYTTIVQILLTFCLFATSVYVIPHKKLLKHPTNSTNVTSLMKFNPQLFVEKFQKANPGKVQEVIDLITNLLTTAGIGREKISKDLADAEAELTVAEETLVAKNAELEEALAAKNAAIAIETQSQNELDEQEATLQSEVATVNIVITLLNGLEGGLLQITSDITDTGFTDLIAQLSDQGEVDPEKIEELKNMVNDIIVQAQLLKDKYIVELSAAAADVEAKTALWNAAINVLATTDADKNIKHGKLGEVQAIYDQDSVQLDAEIENLNLVLNLLIALINQN